MENSPRKIRFVVRRPAWVKPFEPIPFPLDEEVNKQSRIEPVSLSAETLPPILHSFFEMEKKNRDARLMPLYTTKSMPMEGQLYYPKAMLADLEKEAKEHEKRVLGKFKPHRFRGLRFFISELRNYFGI